VQENDGIIFVFIYILDYRFKYNTSFGNFGFLEESLRIFATYLTKYFFVILESKSIYKGHKKIIL